MGSHLTLLQVTRGQLVKRLSREATRGNDASGVALGAAPVDERPKLGLLCYAHVRLTPLFFSQLKAAVLQEQPAAWRGQTFEPDGHTWRKWGGTWRRFCC